MYQSRCGIVLTGDPIAICAIEIVGADNPAIYKWLVQRLTSSYLVSPLYRFPMKLSTVALDRHGCVDATPIRREPHTLEVHPISNITRMTLWVCTVLGAPDEEPITALATMRRAEFRIAA